MRPLSAIFFFILLLFNGIGFRLLTVVLESRAGEQLENRLDRHEFDESDIVTLKIKADHVAYGNWSVRFERAVGQLTVTGKVYHYVERRFYHDSVELRCIADARATQVRSAANDFYKLVNDLPATTSNPASGHHGHGSTPDNADYFPAAIFPGLAAPAAILCRNASHQASEPAEGSHSGIDHPPQEFA